MAHEWNIRPRGRGCVRCDKRFKSGEECLSLLLTTDGGYERSDYCVPCWELSKEDVTPFSLWQGEFIESLPAAQRSEPLQRETAEALLRRLVALEDPANANVVYILAVMLERKKQLIERDTRQHETGGLLRIYEHRASGDTFVILDPQLQLDAIAEVQQQVVAMLGGDEATTEGDTVAGGEPEFDLLLRGGTLFDGSGGAAVVADVAVRDGKIVAVGELSAAGGRQVIEAAGLWVMPGFIDVHSHSDAYLLVEPDAPSKIRQGFTTEIVVQCGSSGAPLLGGAQQLGDTEAVLSELGLAANQEGGAFWRSMAGYRGMLESRGHAVNVVAFVGHNLLRAAVMGYEGRAATEAEVAAMVKLLEQSLDEGASGLSTGLIYRPGCFSEPEEVVALARATAMRGGHYATHMRSEGEQLEESVAEVLALVRATGVKTQISHLKTSGSANWHKLDNVLALLNEARAAGCHLYADRYPYCASATSLSSRLPLWAKAGDRETMLARLNDAVTARRLIEELTDNTTAESWEGALIGSTRHPALYRFRGKPITVVADAWSCTAVEAFVQILRMDKLQTGAFFASMTEENMRRIYREPWVMVGSDSSIRATSGALSHDHPHPRNYATAIRFLKLAAAGELGFELGEAVRRLTSLPAEAFQLAGRGRIEPGYWADLVVIDLDNLHENSNFAVPHSYAGGVCQTIVNGRIAFDGTTHPARPGQWLVCGSKAGQSATTSTT